MKPEILHLLFAALLGAGGMGLFVTRKKPHPPTSEMKSESAAEPRTEETKTSFPKSESDFDVKKRAAEIMKGSDAEYRFFVSEIAGSITKDWRFRFQMLCGLIVVFVVGFWAVYTGLGWSIKDAMDHESQEVTRQIKDRFDDKNIQATLQDVAANEAHQLLLKSIQPSITDFHQHLDAQKDQADKELSVFRDELAKLEKRNEIMTLGDKAVAGGDVAAFKRLRTMTGDSDTEISEAANAEYLRVLQADGPLGLTYPGLKLQVPNGPDGKARNDDDLSVDEILAKALPSTDTKVRFRAGQLLQSKGKPLSYSTAKSIETAIETETNLLAIRELKNAFKHVVPSFTDQYSLDGQDVIDWWKAHEGEVEKADSDAKPSVPAVAPSAPPTSAPALAPSVVPATH